MKLLIATGLYPPDIGGPATYTVFLEQRLPPMGVAIAVLPFGLVRRYPPLFRHVLYLLHLLRALRSCDVVYALDTVSVGLPALLASIFSGKPLLLRVPGDYAWEQGQQRFGITETLDVYRLHPGDAHLPVRVLAWVQTRVARHATRIIVPSDYMAGVVAGWGVDPTRITRIYSALKVIEVPESRAALRARLGYDGIVVLTAGRLVPWKGYRAVIDAVLALRDRGVPISLRVIGEGVEEARLRAHVESIGAEGYVTFLGKLPRERLGEHKKAADVFVLNTSYEGLSHELIEVMALGTPIVTTPVGGNTELIVDGESGLLVPFNDVPAITAAIRDTIDDPEAARVRSTRAGARVHAFHEDVAIDSFVRMLADAFPGR